MRQKLPDRRLSINLPIKFQSAAGREIKILITVGYEVIDGRYLIREVFTADFKAGSDNQALVMDACVLFSRLLQHGNTPEELFKAMCSPPSLIGVIAQVMMGEQLEASMTETLASFEKRGSNSDGQHTDA